MLHKGNLFKQTQELHCALEERQTMGKQWGFGSVGSWHKSTHHMFLFSLF